MDTLERTAAVQYLGLDIKTFNNFFQGAKEFSALPRAGNGRFKFSKSELAKWKQDFQRRTVTLSREDYNLCLDFGLAMHFRGYVLSDWGTARQREFGQKISNWIRGQLGEVAVQKFIKQEFGVDLELDFSISSTIVEQDIVGIDGRRPKLGVGVKTSKPKSNALVLSANEVEIATRSSDVYIFCRTDLPDDHLLRISYEETLQSVKNKPHFDKYAADLPRFTDIKCEIAGFCYKKELEKATFIPGLVFDNGYRWIKLSGNLHRSASDWKDLINKL